VTLYERDVLKPNPFCRGKERKGEETPDLSDTESLCESGVITISHSVMWTGDQLGVEVEEAKIFDVQKFTKEENPSKATDSKIRS
jgi:hypothetical protein